MQLENPVKSLTPSEWDILNFIEQRFQISGEIPTQSEIAEATGLSPQTITKAFKTSLLTEALANRGIALGESGNLLSADQLAAIAVFFDTKDGRSLKKKLNDIGVTTQQWAGWKKDKVFSEHLRTMAENALVHNLAETEVSLMDSAHRGDISAIKLHLELTGRWSSKTVGELNVEFLMMKILETLQRHVKDQDTLLAIASELQALVPSNNQQTPQPQMIPAGSPFSL